jgi:hypothetical protein
VNFVITEFTEVRLQLARKFRKMTKERTYGHSEFIGNSSGVGNMLAVMRIRTLAIKVNPP